jgi:hypothetical protein
VRELRELRDAKKRGKKSLTGVGMAGMGRCEPGKISPDQIRATEVLVSTKRDQ